MRCLRGVNNPSASPVVGLKFRRGVDRNDGEKATVSTDDAFTRRLGVL
jgi:hypothetical protein